MLKDFPKLRLIYLCSLFLLLAQVSFAQALTPNDMFYSEQWYLDKLQMPSVWQLETGNSQAVIAVIDSGVDITHPDLQGNIWINQKEIYGDGIDNDNNGYIDDIHGWDFIEKSNDPSPKFNADCVARELCVPEAVFHGTFVAGVAAAVGNNTVGISGVSWGSKIMPLRVLNQAGIGNTYEVIKAINYAIDNGADIINLSFVGDTYDPSLKQALEKAYQENILVVAAAGNEIVNGQRINLDVNKMYPICHQGSNGENIILGVGASDENNKLAEFSNYGSSCIDILAPGKAFFGTLVYSDKEPTFNKYYGGEFSGTSLAAPIVSGIAALIKSAKPNLTNKEISDYILNNADNLDALNPDFAGWLGKGLINPGKIFQSLQIGLSSDRLIKDGGSTIYYYALDGKRYVFPEANTYFSWYSNFDNVKSLPMAELAAIPMGGNVTVRPGIKLIKIQTVPDVYAVTKGGILRWLKTEDIAAQIYGPNWQSYVVDIPDVFWINYTVGQPIASASDYNLLTEINNVLSIDIDKGLTN